MDRNIALVLITDLRKKLSVNNQKVSEIEMISGNYGDKGDLVSGKIPTITTEFCEIGAYNNICYFTIILNSKSFSKELFSSISNYPNIQLYGLKSFKENYYPKEDFSYNELVKQIFTERFMQIQYNFDISKTKPADVLKSYLEIKSVFERSKTSVINQLVENCI